MRKIFGEEELHRLLCDGDWSEVWGLFGNPKIEAAFFRALYERRSFAADLPEDRWALLVEASTGASRLTTHDDDETRATVFRLLEIAPATSEWLDHIYRLLDDLPASPGNPPPGFDAVVRRWSTVTNDLSGEQSREVQAELAGRIQQVLCLIYLHYGRDVIPPEPPDSAASKSKRGNRRDTADDVAAELAKLPDLPTRCAYYANRKISGAVMKAGYNRDYDVFAMAVLFNDTLYYDQKLRRLYEEEYLPRELHHKYLLRCNQLHRRMPYLQTDPLSPSLWSVKSASESASFLLNGMGSLVADVRASKERIARIDAMFCLLAALLIMAAAIGGTILGVRVLTAVFTDLFGVLGWHFKFGFEDPLQGLLTFGAFAVSLAGVLIASSWLLSRLSTWVDEKVSKLSETN